MSYRDNAVAWNLGFLLARQNVEIKSKLYRALEELRFNGPKSALVFAHRVYETQPTTDELTLIRQELDTLARTGKVEKSVDENFGIRTDVYRLKQGK